MHTERVAAPTAPGRSERLTTAHGPLRPASPALDGTAVPAPELRVPPLPPRELGAEATATTVAPAAERPHGVVRRLKLVMVLADLLAVSAGMAAAISIYRWRLGPLQDAVAVAVLSLPVWPLLFAQQGLYQARHVARRIEEFRRLVNAVVAGVIALAGISVLLQISLSRGWILLAGGGVMIATAIEREGVRAYVAHLRRTGRMSRRVVLVGENSEADELSDMLRHSSELGYDVVGRVTSNPVEPGSEVQHAHDVPHLGQTEDILAIVRRHQASGVVVATTDIDLERANRLVRDLTREGIYVELSSAMKDIATRRVTLRPLGRYPVMCVEPVAQGGSRAVFKRTFDIVCACIGLVLTSPILLVAAAAIRISSGPGVLFAQTRVGKDGNPFTVYKLRTMVPNAESMLPSLMDRNEASGPMFKMTDDPRVTRVGAFLRKTSIDELPQLLNVVTGKMSLVGPRPALPHEAVQWNDDLKERLRVKPGITGNWQVNGRFTASIEDYQRLDMYYVDNWSIVTDLVILAKTVPAVLKRKGAA